MTRACTHSARPCFLRKARWRCFRASSWPNRWRRFLGRASPSVASCPLTAVIPSSQPIWRRFWPMGRRHWRSPWGPRWSISQASFTRPAHRPVENWAHARSFSLATNTAWATCQPSRSPCRGRHTPACSRVARRWPTRAGLAPQPTPCAAGCRNWWCPTRMTNPITLAACRPWAWLCVCRRARREGQPCAGKSRA